jgi:hypothetical protein
LSTNVGVQGFDSGPESQNQYYKEDAAVKINEKLCAHAQHEERRQALKTAIPD